MRSSIAVLLLLVLIVSLAGSVSADPIHWYKDKKFLVGLAVIAGSVAFDNATTAHAMRYPNNYETNWLLGRHPSPTGLAFEGLGAFAGEGGLHFLLYHFSRPDHAGKNWFYNTAGYVVQPSISFLTHVPAGIRNLQLK